MLNMRVFNCLCRLGAIFLVAFGPLALTLAEANDNINAESEIASNNTSATPSRKDATLTNIPQKNCQKKPPLKWSGFLDIRML